MSASAADLVALAGFSILFAVSGYVLSAAGLNYAAPGGNPLGKVHPGTLLIGLSIAMRVWAAGPHEAVSRLLARPGLVALAAGLFFLFGFAALNLPVPLTPLVETFGLPLLVFSLFALRPGGLPDALVPILHGVFALNAAVGLVEFATDRRLTPLTYEEAAGPEWRSSALFGHPLSNAMLTGCYAVAMLAGARGLTGRARMLALCLQCAALVVFGGRAAIVATAAAVAVMAALRVAGFLLGGRARLGDIVLALAVVVGLAAGILALAETGFFDLLVQRFVDDDGSARTRIVMFDLVGRLSPGALLFGPDPDLVASLTRMEGLELGIESFPVALVLKFGLVPAAILLGAVAIFSLDLVRVTRPAAAAVLLFFFAVAATSLSIAEKTTILGLVTTIVLVLLAPAHPPDGPVIASTPE